MSKLEELLSKLPSIDQSSQAVVYEGKAVSRDKDTIHLAVSSGVVAIPLADIAEVKGLSGQSSDIVSVSVKSVDRIRQIRQASPMFRRGGLGGIFGGGGFGGGFGNTSGTFSNGRYVDSATASGGAADSTDDTVWVEESDDVWT